jgi:hypothetical protein
MITTRRIQYIDKTKAQQRKSCKPRHVSATYTNQHNIGKNIHHSSKPINTYSNYTPEKQTNQSLKLYIQEIAGSSRALFQERQPPNIHNSTNTMCNSSSRTPPGHKDITMEEVNTNKQQHGEEASETSKRRTATTSEEQSKHNPYHKLKLWFGYPIMEQLVSEDGQHPIDQSDINIHLVNGLLHDEARILSNASISFPRVLQQLWPNIRQDGKPRQHYHLTQIPFDAEISSDTGNAKTYQILLHFEKTSRDYSSKEITVMTTEQFQKMCMELGEILEPITGRLHTTVHNFWKVLYALKNTKIAQFW